MHARHLRWIYHLRTPQEIKAFNSETGALIHSLEKQSRLHGPNPLNRVKEYLELSLEKPEQLLCELRQSDLPADLFALYKVRRALVLSMDSYDTYIDDSFSTAKQEHVRLLNLVTDLMYQRGYSDLLSTHQHTHLNADLVIL